MEASSRLRKYEEWKYKRRWCTSKVFWAEMVRRLLALPATIVKVMSDKVLEVLVYEHSSTVGRTYGSGFSAGCMHGISSMLD